MEEYLKEKRQELMWSIAKQGYSAAQVGRIFGLSRSTAADIIKKMPVDWQSPWVKVK
jgi:transposase